MVPCTWRTQISNLCDTAVDLLRELGEAAIFHDLGVQPGRHYVAAQVLAVVFGRLKSHTARIAVQTNVHPQAFLTRAKHTFMIDEPRESRAPVTCFVWSAEKGEYVFDCSNAKACFASLISLRYGSARPRVTLDSSTCSVWNGTVKKWCSAIAQRWCVSDHNCVCQIPANYLAGGANLHQENEGDAIVCGSGKCMNALASEERRNIRRPVTIWAAYSSLLKACMCSKNPSAQDAIKMKAKGS